MSRTNRCMNTLHVYVHLYMQVHAYGYCMFSRGNIGKKRIARICTLRCPCISQQNYSCWFDCENSAMQAYMYRYHFICFPPCKINIFVSYCASIVVLYSTP